MSDPVPAEDASLPARLARSTRFDELVHLATCESTQDEALRGGVGNRVVWSDRQTAGRGRQGRRWSGEPELDVEVTFRVEGVRTDDPTRFAAAIPTAVCLALESIAERELALKWPNDILCDGRKLSGVLIDAHGSPTATYLVGVGVNVNRTRFPPELTELATSLAAATGREFSRTDVVLALARAVDRAFDDVASGDTGRLESSFRDRLGLEGRSVRIETGSGESVRGRVVGLDFGQVRLDDGRRFATATLRKLVRSDA